MIIHYKFKNSLSIVVSPSLKTKSEKSCRDSSVLRVFGICEACSLTSSTTPKGKKASDNVIPLYCGITAL